MKKYISTVIATILTFSMTMPAFAGNGDAFSVGCVMKGVNGYTGKTDTTGEAIYANDIFENYYDGILKTAPEQSDFSSNNLNSSALFLAGLGSSTDMSWPYYNSSKIVGITTSRIPINNFTSIENQDFSNTIIGILAACHSGENGGVADYVNENGAKCTIGWRGVVNDVGMKDYCYLLLDYLDDGKNMLDAVSNTIADLANGDGQSGLIWDNNGYSEEDRNVIKTFVYGNYNYGLEGFTRSSKINQIDFQFTSPDSNAKVYRDIENLKYNVGSKNYSEIADYIQNNIDSQFDLKNFKVSEMEMVQGSGRYLITFTYYIEDFKTDFAYNVFVINDEVVEISQTGNEIYNLDIAFPDDTNTFIDILNDDSISTSVRKRFDTKDKKFYYDVFTTYTDDNGTESCTMETFEF